MQKENDKRSIFLLRVFLVYSCWEWASRKGREHYFENFVSGRVQSLSLRPTRRSWRWHDGENATKFVKEAFRCSPILFEQSDNCDPSTMTIATAGTTAAESSTLKLLVKSPSHTDCREAKQKKVLREFDQSTSDFSSFWAEGAVHVQSIELVSVHFTQPPLFSLTFQRGNELSSGRSWSRQRSRDVEAQASSPRYHLPSEPCPKSRPDSAKIENPGWRNARRWLSPPSCWNCRALKRCLVENKLLLLHTDRLI